MGEHKQKEANQAEEIRRLKLENALYRCLLGILIFEANQGAGDYWRGVFSPNLITLGKKFTVSVSTAAENALPADLLNLAKEYLKVELPPSLSEVDLAALKAMIPADVLKKTILVTVTPNISEVGSETIKVGVGGNEKEEIRDPASGDKSGLAIYHNGEERDPEAPIQSSSRFKSRYCDNCRQFYNPDQTHTCLLLPSN